MKFSTPVDLPSWNYRISYSTSILSVGSCFSENIGGRLNDLKFNVNVNPCGIVYNPISVCKTIHSVITGREYATEDLVNSESLWHSYDFHGQFSHSDPNRAVSLMNASIASANSQIRNLDFLILTFGTAYVFELKSDGQAVSNCHKLPGSIFSRRQLKFEEIVDSVKQSLEDLMALRPDLKIILTVSPVRHLRDGLVNNMRSKSLLISACHQLCEMIPSTVYFPSFELINDELRDYRFYSDDMAHPSPKAVDFVWEKFKDCGIQSSEWPIMERIARFKSSLKHKPLHPESKGYLEFLENLKLKLHQLETEFPFLKWQEEKEMILHRIANLNQ